MGNEDKVRRAETPTWSELGAPKAPNERSGGVDCTDYTKITNNKKMG